ncbi:choice-of-anchor L domain-containing protein [Coleofasciculus sp. F4-SAH-05]|uniref:choice-of-anchor L domain-containing protein n=1 Tax=Coleofasciculus sp. F4-SAH-05 TaxID=3069525 RepID=UPI004063A484
MGLLPIKTTMTTIATTALLSFGGLPAMAFTIMPGGNAQDLLDVLLGDTTGLSNFGLMVYDDLGNVNNETFGLFSDDPFGLGEGIVLSTGKVDQLPGLNTKDGGIVPNFKDPQADLSTDFYPQGPFNETGFAGFEGDSITLELSFDADSTVDKVFFEYVFGSEEFVEFGGTEYNDSFKMFLNGESLARLSDGQPVTINNLVPDPNDPTSYHPDFIYNPVGSGVNTKLDGYTKNLTFEGQLIKNDRNTIRVNVADWGDGILDAAVLIKGKSLGTKPPQLNPQPEPNDDPSDEPQFPSDGPVTDPGTLFPPDDPEPQSVPEPSGLLGLLGVATLGIRTMLRRKQQVHLQKH